MEKQIQDHGFHVCLAGEQDVKRILAVYYQQNVVTEHFDQVDGERWVDRAWLKHRRSGKNRWKNQRSSSSPRTFWT